MGEYVYDCYPQLKGVKGLLRECDLPEEADNLVFIKYGETTEELNRTYTDLMRVFESHGVEKNMIDYILSSINSKYRLC